MTQVKPDQPVLQQMLPDGRYSDTPQYHPEKLRPWPLRLSTRNYVILGDLSVFVLAFVLFGTGSPIEAQLGLLGVVGVLFLRFGLYRPRVNLSVLDDLPYLMGGCTAGVLVGASSMHVFPSDVSASSYLLQMTCFFVTAVLLRGIEYYGVRKARQRGLIRRTAVVLGAGNVGVWLTRTLIEHREYGMDVAGLLGDRPRIESGESLPAPLLGGYAELPEVIEDFDVRVVIVAFGSMPESALVEVLRTCDRLKCEMLMVPRLYEVHATTRDMDEIQGMPLVRMRRAAFRTAGWRAKRLVDVAISGFALLVLSPMMLVCAALVLLEGGRGVLFRQERIGMDGDRFQVIKFRSMKPATSEESRLTWSITSDSRIGPVGRFLRTTSLDELPQLWNVLRGDMSLVGPRPERPHFVDQFGRSIPRYRWRHRVPSGLTGWAQVNGLRGDTSIEQRARFDNYYIENWSLWLDFRIMLRTLWQVLAGKGG